MIKFNIVVHPPNTLAMTEDWRTLAGVSWPTVPTKGQEIYLGPKGTDGVRVRVKDVRHWLGCGDIDVHCDVADPNPVDEFLSLTEENGWTK